MIPRKENGFNQDQKNVVHLLANQVRCSGKYIPLAKILISLEESTTTLYRLCGNQFRFRQISPSRPLALPRIGHCTHSHT